MTRLILRHVSVIPDPRRDRGRRNKFIDVLTIAVLAMLCGAKRWSEMEAFRSAREEWLKEFLDLRPSIPRVDTFGEVFAALNPDAFEVASRAWTLSVADEISDVLATDGNMIRRRFDSATDKSGVHMVTAFAVDNEVVFG